MNKVVLVVVGSPTVEVVEDQLLTDQVESVGYPSRLDSRALQHKKYPHPYYYYYSKLTFLEGADSLSLTLLSTD